MRDSIRIVCAALFFSVAGRLHAEVSVKLTIENGAGVKRIAEPVTTGVPFAKGAIKDVAKLALAGPSGKIPAQFTLLCPWDDGSVRWALLDTQVDVGPNGKVEVSVTDGGTGQAPAKPVKVEDQPDTITVSTGPLEFVVDKKKFNLFRSVKVDGKEQITGGDGLALVLPDGKSCTVGDSPMSVKLEQAGQMKAVVCVHGKFAGMHNGLLEYTVRITAYAGQRFVKVHTWLENQGGYGYSEPAEWLVFDGLCLDLGLGLGDGITAKCEDATATDRLLVEQLGGNEQRYSSMKYTIKSGDQELKSGARTDGVVLLSGPGGALTVALRHFWQNYEKAIELDDRRLKLWLWPKSGQWPRSIKRGESANEFGTFQKPGLYALPGGVHKGHEAILDFSGRPPDEAACTLSRPLLAVAAPAYYAGTLAAPGWFAPADFESAVSDYDAIVKRWNKMARNAVDPDAKSGLIAARNGKGDKFGFWYGWMDFGDLCWQPGFNSLHYDWTWIMLLNFLRTGERNFFDMGMEMERHRADVDQIWSDRVNKSFRGLTRYEKAYANIHGGLKGGSYKPIISHHWATGLALYYMLTGEQKAKDAALRSAQGVILRQVDKYRNAPSSGDQARSSGWSILVLCAAYDLTTDKKYLDEALVLWENNLKLKWKEFGVAFGAESNMIMYFYCIYPLCEFHARTGNAEILEFLKAGADAGVMSNNAVEVNHLSNLYAYIALQTGDESYLEKGHQAFALAMGKSDDPAVFTGGGAWSKESAKRLRYAHILQYYYWQKAQGR